MKTYDTGNRIFSSKDEQAAVYNGLDTLVTRELKDKLPATDWSAYEHSLLGPIFHMMQRGLRVDLLERDRLVTEMDKRLAKLHKTLDRFCIAVGSPPINMRSNPQLLKLFYETLAVPKQVSVKKGVAKVSLDGDALEKIQKSYIRAIPFCRLVLRIRNLEKFRDALTKGLSPSGRFKSSYSIAGTDTGRLSSSTHPLRLGGNGQNLAPEARRIMVADPGYVLCYTDLQGAEARAVAFLAGDENYIKGVESGDVHTLVASMVWGFEQKRALADRKFYQDFTYRDLAKRATHGTSYGGQPSTIARVLKVERPLIEDFQRKFFKAFPGIKEWQLWTARELQEKGRLTTPFGMTRTFWGRRWEDTTLREAIAFVPQSTIATVMNLGMLKVWRKYKPPRFQLLANVHDAILFQIPIAEREELLPQIIEDLKIPVDVTDIHGKIRTLVIPVEAHVGLNWGDKESVLSFEDGTIKTIGYTEKLHLGDIFHENQKRIVKIETKNPDGMSK